MSGAQIYRPLSSDKPNRVAVKMPFDGAGGRKNRAFLLSVMGERARPQWNRSRGAWEVARNHFGPLVRALADHYGSVAVTAAHSNLEKCTTQCQAANPETWIECTCVCGGLRHGQGGGGKAVGDGSLLVYSDRTIRKYVVKRGGVVE